MAQPFWASTDDTIEGFGISAGALAWDQPLLDGTPLPGLWSVSVRLARDIEKKKQKGKDSAAITDQGDSPAEIRIEGEIYTDAAWEAWQTDILPKIASKKAGNERAPMVIDHPMTASYGIVNIYVEECESKLDIDSDTMRINIKAIEWTPRPKEPVIKKNAQQDINQMVMNQAVQSMVDAQVAALNDQFKQNAPRPV